MQFVHMFVFSSLGSRAQHACTTFVAQHACTLVHIHIFTANQVHSPVSLIYYAQFVPFARAHYFILFAFVFKMRQMDNLCECVAVDAASALTARAVHVCMKECVMMCVLLVYIIYIIVCIYASCAVVRLWWRSLNTPRAPPRASYNYLNGTIYSYIHSHTSERAHRSMYIYVHFKYQHTHGHGATHRTPHVLDAARLTHDFCWLAGWLASLRFAFMNGEKGARGESWTGCVLCVFSIFPLFSRFFRKNVRVCLWKGPVSSRVYFTII